MNAVDLARQLIAMRTVNPPGNERDCAYFLGGMLEAAGFRCRFAEFAEGRTSLIARAGPEDAVPLALSGHLDTVPVGDDPWRHDPFAGEIAEGLLYGRGAADMKSGVAAMVTAALRAAAASGNTIPMLLILTAGEEAGCVGAAFLAKADPPLPAASALVVGEPTSAYPCIAHKGILWFDLQADGQAAHGSVPEKGVNAIYRAARAIGRLETLAFPVPSHPLLGRPTLNVGLIAGGLAFNIVPDRAAFSLDIRTIPGQDHETVVRQVRACLEPDARIAGRRLACRPIETDPGNAWIQSVYGLMTPLLGGRPEPRGIAYFTDASDLRGALGEPPVLILGPGDVARIHKPDECCPVEQIDLVSEAYFQILMAS